MSRVTNEQRAAIKLPCWWEPSTTTSSGAVQDLPSFTMGVQTKVKEHQSSASNGATVAWLLDELIFEAYRLTSYWFLRAGSTRRSSFSRKTADCAIEDLVFQPPVNIKESLQTRDNHSVRLTVGVPNRPRCTVPGSSLHDFPDYRSA